MPEALIFCHIFNYMLNAISLLTSFQIAFWCTFCLFDWNIHGFFVPKFIFFHHVSTTGSMANAPLQLAKDVSFLQVFFWCFGRNEIFSGDNRIMHKLTENCMKMKPGIFYDEYWEDEKMYLLLQCFKISQILCFSTICTYMLPFQMTLQSDNWNKVIIANVTLIILRFCMFSWNVKLKVCFTFNDFVTNVTSFRVKHLMNWWFVLFQIA